MRQRAKWNLKIATNQFQRELYKEAELTLVQVTPHLTALSAADREKYAKLNKDVQNSLQEKRNIIATLKLSDDLAAKEKQRPLITWIR